MAAHHRQLQPAGRLFKILLYVNAVESKLCDGELRIGVSLQRRFFIKLKGVLDIARHAEAVLVHDGDKMLRTIIAFGRKRRSSSERFFIIFRREISHRIGKG